MFLRNAKIAGISKLCAPKLIGTHNWLTSWDCHRTSPSRFNAGNDNGRRDENSNSKDGNGNSGNGWPNSDSDGNGGDSWCDSNGDGRCDGNAMVTTATAVEGATATATATVVMVGATVMGMEGKMVTRWR